MLRSVLDMELKIECHINIKQAIKSRITFRTFPICSKVYVYNTRLLIARIGCQLKDRPAQDNKQVLCVWNRIDRIFSRHYLRNRSKSNVDMCDYIDVN